MNVAAFNTSAAALQSVVAAETSSMNNAFLRFGGNDLLSKNAKIQFSLGIVHDQVMAWGPL